MQKSEVVKRLKIHLCVCGGIAAYKVADLVSTLRKRGHEVTVAMSDSAASFVSPLTFQALSGNDVFTSLLDPGQEGGIGHIEFAQEADILVVAPATANILAKAALGIGDDLVSTILLATNRTVVFAPAMNTQMWQNPATAAHVQTLKSRNHCVVEPDVGLLACGANGAGRLPETESLVGHIEAHAESKPQDLRGLNITIASGPTREFIDPVRFLSNPSSGRTGVALAEEALSRGAAVTLIMGPTSMEPLKEGIDLVSVVTAEDMYRAVMETVDTAQVVIMSAAVADWTPENVATSKTKKIGTEQQISLVRTKDILAELGTHPQRTRFMLIGYAAETNDVIANAREKLLRKNADLIVGNDVSVEELGFGSNRNAVFLVSAEGVVSVPETSKREIARLVLDRVATRCTL